MHYQVTEATPEEVASADPFEGRGAFLPMDASADGILRELEAAFAAVLPAVAIPGRGAWVDAGGIGIDPREIARAWSSRGGK